MINKTLTIKRAKKLTMGLYAAVAGMALLGQSARAGAIGSGYYNSIGLKSDGTVAAWGTNFFGTTVVPPGLSNVVSVVGGAGFHLALKGDGTVTGWGWSGDGSTNIPAGLTNVISISGGGDHSLALKSDGTVVAWGSNAYHQAAVPAGLGNVIAISGGVHRSLALKSDGTVVTWGAPLDNQDAILAGLTNVVGIAGGQDYSLALKGDGTVAAWGGNSFGQTNVPNGLNNVVSIAIGSYHSLALKSDGTVAVWGFNNEGQATVPTGLSNVVSIAGGAYHSLVLKSDGSVFVWGSTLDGRTNVPAGSFGGTTATWNSASGGDFLASRNWKYDTPSTAVSDAVFSLPNAYAVSFGADQRAKNINVSAGTVSFNLGAKNYKAAGNLNVSNATVGLSSSTGMLDVSGFTTIGPNGTINTTGGALKAASVSVQSGGTLKGTGRVTANVSVAGTLSPGNSPGTLPITGNSSFEGSGSYVWEINDAIGNAGDSPGWDLYSVSGILTINSDPIHPFRIKIRSLTPAGLPGDAAGFDPNGISVWTIATATGGISGFTPNNFLVDDSGFTNSHPGQFSVMQSGNDLQVMYTVPEPATGMLILVAAATGMVRRKRREITQKLSARE